MRKAHWLVTLPGRLPFSMVGAPKSKTEALEYARGIWPLAEVE